MFIDVSMFDRDAYDI